MQEYTFKQEKITAFKLDQSAVFPDWLQTSNQAIPLETGAVVLKSDKFDKLVNVGDYIILNKDNSLTTLKEHIFEEQFQEWQDPPEDFAWAFNQLKNNRLVARKAWHGGDNVWLSLVIPNFNIGSFLYNNPVNLASIADEIDPELQQSPATSVEVYNEKGKKYPSILLKNIDDAYICGWQPTIEDLMAQDWFIVA